MASNRQNRINEDFKREIAIILPTLKDPRLDSLLSIMRVNVSSDLSYAKVYVGSVYGYDKAKEACKVLKNASGHIRSRLSSVLRIRKVPELNFIADDSAEYSERISAILDNLK